MAFFSTSDNKPANQYHKSLNWHDSRLVYPR
uniref:Uncharacterized protein n=1 Tax=Anguilla anguilla TaxID=7936 RepID=A0A0E9T7J4_ANGAN